MELIIDITSLSKDELDSLITSLNNVPGVKIRQVQSRSASGKWYEKLIVTIELITALSNFVPVIQPYISPEVPKVAITVVDQDSRIEIQGDTENETEKLLTMYWNLT